jgi:hypothetical protein
MPRKTAEAAATTKTPATKTATRRTRKKAEEPIVLTWEHVATRAYYIHLETGESDPVENWLRAERELVVS